MYMYIATVYFKVYRKAAHQPIAIAAIHVVLIYNSYAQQYSCPAPCYKKFKATILIKQIKGI